MTPDILDLVQESVVLRDRDGRLQVPTQAHREGERAQYQSYAVHGGGRVAYRPAGASKDHTAFSVAGPFRYLRNPQYLSYFLLILALGTFQSLLGFPVMLLAETILLLRLVARETIRRAARAGPFRA